MTDVDPIVFVHYSWDDEDHKNWVRFLADRLISDGIEVVFDRYDLKLGSNNNYFMEKIQSADKVILIMTTKYKSKAESRIAGIGYEYQIITTEISKAISTNNKFIPILRNGTKEDSVPLFLQAFLYLDVRDDKMFEVRYLELLKNIYDEPILVKPVKGKRPNFKKLEKQINSKLEPEYIKVLKLGLTRKECRKILGEPQNEIDLADTFWSHGIQVYYNRHWDKNDGVMVRRQPSGISFEGEIIGIRLGESFAEIKAKLGNPINWGLPDPYTSFAFYKIKERFLTVALWRNKPEGDFSDFKLGSAYAIGYCEPHSILACEPIVAVTIEEIRAGKKLSYLEREYDDYDIDFTSDIFHENYIIVPTQFGIYGGYFVSVYFKDSGKIVDFWLYDLAWSYLVIRMISIRQSDNKLTEESDT